MDEEIKDDQSLTVEQQAKVEALSVVELNAIDNALIENTTHHWRKVARVVMSSMQGLEGRVKGIPDVFYGQRVKALVDSGQLESQGNLNRMRYSEVKRPDLENETSRITNACSRTKCPLRAHFAADARRYVKTKLWAIHSTLLLLV